MQEAHAIARRLNLVPPALELNEYNMLRREKLDACAADNNYKVLSARILAPTRQTLNPNL